MGRRPRVSRSKRMSVFAALRERLVRWSALMPHNLAWVGLVAAVAAVLVVAIGELSYQRSSASLEQLARRSAAHTTIQNLLRRLLDAETSQRGYLLTGRPEYLAPNARAATDIDAALVWLKARYRDDAASLATVDELSKRSLEKLSEISETIRLYDQDAREAWATLVLTNIGREKMESVRLAAQTLLDHENQLLTDERNEVHDSLALGRLGIHALTILGLLSVLVFLRQTAALNSAQREHAAALQSDRDALDGQVRERTAELTELAGHLQSAREDERRRLARELHDELGALLTAAKFDLARLKRTLSPDAVDSAQRLASLASVINQGISLKRRIIEDLHPSSLSNLGLAAAVAIQVREFEQGSGIRTHARLAEVRLPDAAQIAVYRVVQESLTNIAKHAQATEIEIDIAADETGAVCLSVADNGRGFDPAAVQRQSHGLVGMRYRIEALGGALQLRSAPGRGTVIEVVIPAAVAGAVTPATEA